MKRTAFILIAIVLAVWTATTSLTRVKPGERAVVRRFGRILDVKPGQGLYIGWPWGVDRVDLVPVGKARQISVGFVNQEETDSELVPIGQMLTGDHNLVNVQVEVNYKVRDDQAEKFLLQADNIDTLVARSAESFLAEWIAARTVDDVLVSGKRILPGVMRPRLQDRLDAYGAGVEVERVNITRLLPPEQVKEAFDRLAQAQTSIRTRENEAQQKASRNKRFADGSAYEMVTSAKSYARTELLKAGADADSFRVRLEQYQMLSRTHPDYLNAIWLDEMTRLYGAMRQGGRIDLLDHYLSKEGITITQFPLLPKRR